MVEVLNRRQYKEEMFVAVFNGDTTTLNGPEGDFIWETTLSILALKNYYAFLITEESRDFNRSIACVVGESLGHDSHDNLRAIRHSIKNKFQGIQFILSLLESNDKPINKAYRDMIVKMFIQTTLFLDIVSKAKASQPLSFRRFEESVALWAEISEGSDIMEISMSNEAAIVSMPPMLALHIHELIINANKHKATKIVINIDMANAGDTVIIRVENNGSKVEDPESLFIEGASKTGTSGIGLYLMRQYLKAQGGEISYLGSASSLMKDTNGENRGASFKLSLPYACFL